ncbi:respiratory nitrate reductase subunit gamma [Thermodesulfovibrio hydrogeniphilus]
MEKLIILLALFSPVILIAGVIFKFYQISKMPLNVRWEIYPVPHGKKDGGSYLEETDWISKEHKKNTIAEITEPLKEIFYLHRVKKFNTYGLWLWSMALHWGLWLMFLWIFFIIIAQFTESFNLSNFAFVPYFAYFLGIIGSTGLILKRLLNRELKLYTSGIDYFNLFFLLSIFSTGFLMATKENFVNENFAYVNGIANLNLALSEISIITIIHFVLFEIFLIYIPFSRFFHGPVKFFTFHKILWNDEYQKKASSEERKIMQQLNSKVKWAGPHILPEQSWLDNAKNTNLHEK